MPRDGLGYLLLGQPALSSLVARALATKGDQPQNLEQRYQLGVNALDLTDPEYRYLMRRPTFGVGVSLAAVAAQFGIYEFGPSAGRPGAVIESLILSNLQAAASGFFFAVTTIASGAVGAGVFGFPEDDRFFSPALVPRGAYSLASGSNAVNPLAGSNPRIVQLPASTSIELTGPWMLSGKDNGVTIARLTVVTSQVNVASAVSVRWRERELLASEL